MWASKKEIRMKLIVLPSGGLANRMFAVCAGLCLSQLTNREMILLWHKDSGLNADYSEIFQYNPTVFKIKNVSDTVYYLYYDLPKKKNLYFPKLLHLFDSKKWIYHISEETAYLDDKFFLESATVINKDIVVASCFPFYEPPHEDYRNLFRPTEKVKNRIKDIRGERPVDMAVQIRRTDHSLSMSKSPLCLFEETVRKEVKSNPHVNIFLATDDQDVKAFFKECFPDNVFFNPDVARRDSLEGIIDGAAEMFIMSSAKVIYGSYSSTFSLMASLIGNTKLVVLQT